MSTSAVSDVLAGLSSTMTCVPLLFACFLGGFRPAKAPILGLRQSSKCDILHKFEYLRTKASHPNRQIIQSVIVPLLTDEFAIDKQSADHVADRHRVVHALKVLGQETEF